MHRYLYFLLQLAVPEALPPSPYLSSCFFDFVRQQTESLFFPINLFFDVSHFFSCRQALFLHIFLVLNALYLLSPLLHPLVLRHEIVPPFLHLLQLMLQWLHEVLLQFLLKQRTIFRPLVTPSASFSSVHPMFCDTRRHPRLPYSLPILLRIPLLL